MCQLHILVPIMNMIIIEDSPVQEEEVVQQQDGLVEDGEIPSTSSETKRIQRYIRPCIAL